MYNYSIIILLLIWVSPFSSQENLSCGDWIPFKDEKCYKFFNHLSSYSDADNYCIQQDKESTLVVIKTKDEQDAIVKLLKVSNVADNVWIGITKKDGVFKNADQTELEFKNWAENRPVPNQTGSDCVDLSTDDSTYGKWFDEKCQKQNAVICQKIQPWSITRLQTTLLDTRRELVQKDLYLQQTLLGTRSELEVLQQNTRKELEATKSQVLNLQQNPVPIGFIYVQVLGQSEPKTLWPNTEWENISPKLAGLFFRVEGGAAAQFGQIQEQKTQSIEMVRKATNENEAFMDNPFTIGNSDRCVFTGANAVPQTYLHMKHNLEEIRPKNSAVKVWQRTK